MAAHARGVPTVRLASRLQLATSFFPASSSRGGQYGRSSAGPPPCDDGGRPGRHPSALPRLGPGGTRRVVEKVAEDIALRRRSSRQLRGPERVERALSEDVLPLVQHPFDRGAVVAVTKEICAHVSAACTDPRLAEGGAHVLVLLDTFACPVVFRAPPPPCKKLMRSAAGAPKSFVVRTVNPCVELEPRRQSTGFIGDGRAKPVEERFEGWLPW